jgi:hypothetical protein
MWSIHDGGEAALIPTRNFDYVPSWGADLLSKYTNERKTIIIIAQRTCSNLFCCDPPDQCEVSFAASEHIQAKDLSQWLIDVSDGTNSTYRLSEKPRSLQYQFHDLGWTDHITGLLQSASYQIP